MNNPFKLLGMLDKFLNWFMWVLGTAFCVMLFNHGSWDTEVISAFGNVVFCCGLYYFWKRGSFTRYG